MMHEPFRTLMSCTKCRFTTYRAADARRHGKSYVYDGESDKPSIPGTIDGKTQIPNKGRQRGPKRKEEERIWKEEKQ
ncbi:hypothetical protein ACF0H5_008236 [Mactra antiquata]